MSEARGAIQDPEQVRRMFDRIARRYDLMNHLMTGWRDSAWRRLTARVATEGGVDRALDIATGTGELANALIEAGARSVTGVDFSEEMVAIARRKFGGHERLSFLVADAMALPFPAGHFEACTIGFGLRNLPDYQAALREMARVLVSGGRLAVLELTPYTTPGLASIFDVYFGRIVPIAGGLVSGDFEAYRYLPRSVRAFPTAEELAAMIWRAGFRDVRWRLLGGGSVALHVGVRA